MPWLQEKPRLLGRLQEIRKPAKLNSQKLALAASEAAMTQTSGLNLEIDHQPQMAGLGI